LVCFALQHQRDVDQLVVLRRSDVAWKVRVGRWRGYVVSRAVRFTSRSDEATFGPGRLVTAPIGTPHTFANADEAAPAVVARRRGRRRDHGPLRHRALARRRL